MQAGPIGRNAEAAGAASTRGVAGIFSYSKTKGLFAGVSLEGSAIIERRDANEKLYGQRYTARQLLEGSVRPPPAAASLMAVLNSRVFAGVGVQGDVYNDIPVYDDQRDDVVWEGRSGDAYNENMARGQQDFNAHGGYGTPKRSDTVHNDSYGSPSGGTGIQRSATGFNDYEYRDAPQRSSSGKVGPGRPTSMKPVFGNKTGNLQENQAVALFTFDADQPGDLAFKKGDIITVTKKTEKAEDWWYVFTIYLKNELC